MTFVRVVNPRFSFFQVLCSLSHPGIGASSTCWILPLSFPFSWRLNRPDFFSSRLFFPSDFWPRPKRIRNWEDVFFSYLRISIAAQASSWSDDAVAVCFCCCSFHPDPFQWEGHWALGTGHLALCTLHSRASLKHRTPSHGGHSRVLLCFGGGKEKVFLFSSLPASSFVYFFLCLSLVLDVDDLCFSLSLSLLFFLLSLFLAMATSCCCWLLLCIAGWLLHT